MIKDDTDTEIHPNNVNRGRMYFTSVRHARPSSTGRRKYRPTLASSLYPLSDLSRYFILFSPYTYFLLCPHHIHTPFFASDDLTARPLPDYTALRPVRRLSKELQRSEHYCMTGV
jgi:hypothetical protein